MPDTMPRPLVLATLAAATVAALGTATPLAAADTEHDGIGTLIHGGSPADTADFPWMMAISYPDHSPDRPSHHSCGGTLVAPDKVVTAAHCVDFVSADDIAVIGGRTNLETTEGTVREVTDMWIHPDWELETEPPEDEDELPMIAGGDIAVLTLAGDMPYPTLELADDDATYTPGRAGRVLGWGLLHDSEDTETALLHQAQIPLVDDAECREHMPWVEYDTDDYFCAGYDVDAVSPCNTDSGGPLVIGGRLAGVTAFAPYLCDTAGGRSYYSRVTTYAEELTEQIWG